ncbi:DUF2267 domain-containing protein [Mesorhizobium sp. KR2-14]|uniref:DUF2267 domain-containing protein n=1 Tax=Mesorhizobium sp. KR2-14 TaxID=3156610 RepID=UPI0032B3FC2D
MSSGHPTFDHTVQEGNIWLKTAAEKLHFDDRRHAYSALRATLHALRDRLTPEMAVHFGAQLPMVIRGLYFEGWHMAEKPKLDHTLDEFCEHVARDLPPKFPIDAHTAAHGIFEVIFEEVDPGEVAKIIDQMPVALRSLWPQTARRG